MKTKRQVSPSSFDQIFPWTLLIIILMTGFCRALSQSDSSNPSLNLIPSQDEFQVTPEMLAKAFAGKATLQNGRLILTYTFRNENELNDFNVDGHAIIQNGTLTIPGDTVLTNKVVFENKAAMSCEIGLGNRGGEHFRTTDGIWVKGSSYNAWFVFLGKGEKQLGGDVFDPSYWASSDINKFLPFTFVADGKRIQVNFGSVFLASQTDKPFQGQLEFCGGAGRDCFRKLIISGVMDKKWAKEFFKPFVEK